MSEIGVRHVLIYLCDLCLGGAGGECHVPGCALWLNRAPDLPLRNNPMVEIYESPGGAQYEAQQEAQG